MTNNQEITVLLSTGVKSLSLSIDYALHHPGCEIRAAMMFGQNRPPWLSLSPSSSIPEYVWLLLSKDFLALLGLTMSLLTALLSLAPEISPLLLLGPRRNPSWSRDPNGEAGSSQLLREGILKRIPSLATIAFVWLLEHHGKL